MNRQLAKTEISSVFIKLPIDIFRLLGLYLDVCDISRLSGLNEKIDKSLCKNQKYLTTLAHMRLTDVDERLANKNIWEELFDTNSLQSAAKKGYLEKIKYFLVKGGDMHIEDNYLLRTASSRSYLDIIEYLVSLGSPQGRDGPRADIHINGDILIVVAANFGQLPTVKYFVDNGLDVNAHASSALTSAVQGNYFDVSRKRLQGLKLESENEKKRHCLTAYRRSDDFGGKVNIRQRKTKTGTTVTITAITRTRASSQPQCFPANCSAL